MGTEITFRRGSTTPTSGSGITLAEPVFNTTLKTFHIGLGHGVTAAWVGAPISGLSAGIAAGLTYQVPTMSAVKDYVASTTSGVSTLNSLTGAVTIAAGTNIGVTTAGSSITVTNLGVQTFNGATGAVTGASLGANTFTALNTFNAGITTAFIYASTGSTFGGTLQVNGGATFSGTVNGATATFNRLLTASGGISASGGMTLDGGTVWHSRNDGITSGLDAGLVHGVCGSRFLENLQTGLLYGGLISVNAGNTAQVNISAGAGIVVSPGASLTAYPIPTVTPVTWAAKTGVTLAGLTSSDETWLAIDSSGNLVQTNVAFTDAQYSSQIPLGAALHLSRTYIQLVKGYPHVSYAQPDQFDPFIRAFGNLKLSGHEIFANGANLNVNRSAGKAYATGRNYSNDPNNPNIVTDTSAAPATGIYRFYRNGSGAFTTVINSAIDPTKYDDGTGTLATATPAKYTIQRLFYLPNEPSLLGVYYGRQEYNSISDAQANIPFEPFSESESTATQGIFCGWLIVQGNCTALNDTARAKFINAGLFRNTSNVGGGGVAIASIDDLNDVTTTTPSNNQVLRWNSGTAQWVNSDVSSLAVSSFNGLTGAVTGASLGANTFTGLNTFSAGITTAFIYASTGSTFGGTLLVNGKATFNGVVDVVNGLTSAGSIRFSGTATKNIHSTQAPIVITGITTGDLEGIGYNEVTIPANSSALSLSSATNSVNIVSTNTLSGIPGLRIVTNDYGVIGEYGTTIKPTSFAGGERTQTLQNANGVIALTSQLMGTVNGSTAATTAVTSFNGRTGAVQGVSAAVAGTGISVSGATGAVTITNTGVTSAVAGTGISVSGATGSVTFTNIGVQSFNGLTGAVLADAVTWSVITADQGTVANKGYFTNKATLLTLSLPSGPETLGSAIRVSGMTAGGWKIQPQGYGVIHFGKTSTSVGGYLQSTHARDSVELICCGFTAGANSWNVVSSVGNIEIV
jgi:hypothetical protein